MQKHRDKNRSPVGWYVATYVERFAFADENDANPRRRCRAWKNAILVRARTPEEAYRRALGIATANADCPWTNHRGVSGKLVFEGFTNLVPLYDALEDGAELAWWDFSNVAVSTVKRMVKPKHRLEVFTKAN